MTTKSGKATVYVHGVGLLRLDDGGLRIVQAAWIDPASHPKLEGIVNLAFHRIDGVHITVREAVGRLAEAFEVPADFVTLIRIVEETEAEPSTDDKTF